MNDTLTVIFGDALEKLRDLPNESVQCCVTSPPYWGLRDYGQNGQLGLEKTPEEYVSKMVDVFREMRRVLRKDGTLWLNLGDSYASASACDRRSIVGNGSPDENCKRPNRLIGSLKEKDLVGIPWRVAFALQSDGWWLRSDIIWNKANCMPESVTDRPTRSHEYLFLLTKSARYYYDSESIKEPASEVDWESRIGRSNLNNKLLPTDELNGIRQRVKYTPNAKRPYGSTLTGGLYGLHHLGHEIPEKERRSDKADRPVNGMRNKRDVWTVAPANYPKAHFATFPADLIKPCILAGTKAGDTVLDPFAGSGTTGQVAIELGRKAVLIELNPKDIELIKQRCDVTPGLALA